VIVAPGTYTGSGNRNLVFPQTGGVARAITVKCVSSAEDCIIDVQGSNPCNSSATQQHRGFVFNNDAASNASVVDGFTIKNGCVWSGATGSYGGGIFINHSAPTIRRCILENNKARYGGGGIALEGSDPALAYFPLIESCTIRNNATLQNVSGGGGIYTGTHMDALVKNTVISGNSSARQGGGIFWGLGSDTRMISCVVENNTAAEGGGGVYVENVKHQPNINDILLDPGPAPYILRSRIGPDNSTTNSRGGGLWINGEWPSNTTPVGFYIEDCTIIDNHADASLGGGLSLWGSADTLELTPRIVNTVFAGNTASSGGAVHILDRVIATFANVTVMHNTVSGGNGGSAIYFQGQRASTVSNSVLWYDAVGPAESQVRVGTSSNDLLTVKWSDVQGGLPSGVTGSNNVDPPSDPSFVDVDGADNTRT